jgi:hypothetical protein
MSQAMNIKIPYKDWKIMYDREKLATSAAKMDPKLEYMTDASLIAALRDCVAAKDELIEKYAVENVRLKQAVHKLADAYYGGERPGDEFEPALDEALKLAKEEKCIDHTKNYKREKSKRS